MNSLEIITVSSGDPHAQSYFCFDEFKQSLRQHNFEPVVLSEGYKYLIDRPKMFLKHLKTNNRTNYVCLCDSWDLLWLDSPLVALDRFKQFNVPILLNSEKNLFPEVPEFVHDYYKDKSCYLNSGWIFAEKTAIVALLEQMGFKDMVSSDITEQGLFHEAYVAQLITMALDEKSEIAQCLFLETEEDFVVSDSGRLYNKIHGTNPVVAHANGPAKSAALWKQLLSYYRKA